MSTREDNIAAPSSEPETKETKEPKLTNYDAIQKLSCKFADYIESSSIKFPELTTVLELLRKHDPAGKIIVIKAIVLPQLDSWQDKARDEAKKRGIPVTDEQIAKVGAFLKAFVEIATA